MKRIPFKIGDLAIETPFVLAPLAGITDKSMRSLCSKQGASLVYTEMVSAKGLWYGDKKTNKLLEIGEDEEKVAFQIFGSDSEIMAFAAKELNEKKNVILDLNVGCPVPKVVKNGEGSALLKKLDTLYDVVESMVKNTAKPVTAKIRMGFEINENTASETAKLLESAGVSAITVHGRTRQQYYEGKADWKAIAQVKESVKVPVIGNGDVFTGEDAVRMLNETGCDGVMIARGALGNPWIFKEANALWRGEEKPAPPTDNEKIHMAINHLALISAHKGDNIAVREMRKHVGWYIKGMKGAAAVRRQANQAVQALEMKKLLESLLK
ncbi:MAG: tRNA dihydrouridine synthase DusB [Anaerovoracaceae bacterium]